ncbi:Kelch domain-containing protein 2 [Armadillidium nasatum]|uniref:Kelch domain-containing protein 2 n=1 Tax=Armadillidium nasatum TaxID=96803 RepID=A0A5N5SJU1_9CRUS|nr:Kelch domain-containing protein 2 [Armadillidium nasatum]
MQASPFSIENFVKRRAGHVVVEYQNKLFMWGGYMEEEHETTYNLMTQSNSQFHNPEEIWIYSPLLNIWIRRRCKGDIPLRLSGSCAGVIDSYMYLFGGFNGEEPFEGSMDILWRLNLETFVWELLVPSGFPPYACDKSASWAFSNRFYVFGGYGRNISERGDAPVPVEFVTEFGVFSKGWLDQLVYYDTTNNIWVWPKSKGYKPSARAAHAAALLKNKVYVFGGRHKEHRLSDFYCLDLETHTWSLVHPCRSSPIPIGRSWHTLTPISENKLLLYGGFSTTCQVLNDAWIYCVKQKTWRQFWPSNDTKRLWHCGARIGFCEVAIIGGIKNNLINYTQPKEHAEEMLRIRFSPPSLFELTIEYLSDTKKVPKESWFLLPQHVRQILEVRTDPFEIHGI